MDETAKEPRIGNYQTWFDIYFFILNSQITLKNIQNVQLHSLVFVCILMNILEVKIVKHMPELKASEQPTIAIVTSLFCEKVAVDAMIEEKTTYVKYKTEGCYKINLDIFHFIILFICAVICSPFV